MFEEHKISPDNRAQDNAKENQPEMKLTFFGKDSTVLKRSLLTILLTSFIMIPVSAKSTLQSVTSMNKHPHTDIHMITPFTAQGLNPKLTITKEIKGICWSSSLVNSSRPNTWRCHAEDKVYDPCFKNSIHNQNSVICLENPWDKKVVQINLTTPLPSNKTASFNREKSEPWAIELGNGRTCTLITGPNSKVAGMSTRYRCTQGSLVVGDIDRSTSRWMVFFLGNEDLYMHQTEVLSAWY